MTLGDGADDTITVPEFADVAAYNANDVGKKAGNHVRIGTRTLPNWMIRNHFGDRAVTANELIRIYADAAAYLADTGRAGRLFAVIDGDLYTVAALEAANNNRALTDSNLPNAIGLPASSTALGVDAAATFYDSTAVGNRARVTGAGGTAVGTGSSAAGTAVALGARADARGEHTVAIGEGARVFDGRSVAVGHFSATSGNEVTAVGTNTHGFGDEAAAFGNGADAFGNSTTALGRGASAADFGAVGARSWDAVPEGIGLSGLIRCALEPGHITDGQSFVDGCSPYLTDTEKAHANLISGDSAGQAYRRTIKTRLRERLESYQTYRATAVGTRASASETDSTALGASAVAGAYASTALGSWATATAREGVAIGHNTGVTGAESVAVGQHAQVHADGSVAVGERAIAGGVDAENFYRNVEEYLGDREENAGTNVLIGGKVYADADLRAVSGLTADNLPDPVVGSPRSTAIGQRSFAAGDAVAVGQASRASAGASTAIGAGSIADDVGASAFGYSGRAHGAWSTALGGDAFGDYSLALNAFSDAVGFDSIAAGRRAVAGLSAAPSRVYPNLESYLASPPFDFDPETGEPTGPATVGNVAIAGRVYSAAALAAVSDLSAATLPDPLPTSPGTIAIGANSIAGGGLPEYADFGAYLADTDRGNGWTRVGDHVYPAREIADFFGDRDYTAADVVAEYADAAAYLEDADRTNRPFAIVDGVLYRVSGLEAANASGRLSAGGFPSPLWQAPGGSGAVAVGRGARAGGVHALAAGESAAAPNAGSVAVGAVAGANGLGTWATSVGAYSAAGGANATALGANARAFGEASAALGALSNAVGDRATAVGAAAVARGARDATALGVGATALGDETTALGQQAVAAAGPDGNGDVFSIVPRGGYLFEMVKCAEDERTFIDDASGFEAECVEYLTASERANADMFAVSEAGEAARGAVQTRLRSRLAGLAADRATAVGAYARASGVDSLALGRGAAALGANAIAIGAGTSASANEVAIGAPGAAYRLPGLTAEGGLARLLAVDPQGRLIAGGADFGEGAPALAVRVATLEAEAVSTGGRVGFLETTTKTLEDEVTDVGGRLGTGGQLADADGSAFQRIAAVDESLGSPDDSGRRDGSAYQRIAAIDDIIQTVASDDPAAVVAARAEQKVDAQTRELTLEGGDETRIREAAVTEVEERVERVRIRTGAGEDRTVVTLKGATNEQILTLVALLTDRRLSTVSVMGADGEPVGTTMNEFLALDENKARTEAALPPEQRTGASELSFKERVAYLFQALYGKPYGEDGAADEATDSDKPHPDSLAGRASIIELEGPERMRLKEAATPETGGLPDGVADRRVVVQDVDAAGRGRLRTLPYDTFDGARALSEVTALTGRVNALTGRVDGVRRDLNTLAGRVDESTAMTSALTALPNLVPDGGRFYVGAGVGNYRGEQALALGVSARLDGESNLFVNAGAAVSAEGSVVSRAGVGFVW